MNRFILLCVCTMYYVWVRSACSLSLLWCRSFFLLNWRVVKYDYLPGYFFILFDRRGAWERLLRTITDWQPNEWAEKHVVRSKSVKVPTRAFAHAVTHTRTRTRTHTRTCTCTHHTHIFPQTLTTYSTRPNQTRNLCIAFVVDCGARERIGGVRSAKFWVRLWRSVSFLSAESKSLQTVKYSICHLFAHIMAYSESQLVSPSFMCSSCTLTTCTCILMTRLTPPMSLSRTHVCSNECVDNFYLLTNHRLIRYTLCVWFMRKTLPTLPPLRGGLFYYYTHS